MAQNPLEFSGLNRIQVPTDVYTAIQKAASRTGVNFSYLMEKAAAESSFNPEARAKTSSATGLFQFIESTWLRMVRDHGAKYGLQDYAQKISDDGRVRDSASRKEILNLRKNPEIASFMAAEFARDNYSYLEKHVGGKIGKTELYLAHFLGAGGAAGFLNALKKNPNMTAADLFPREARSNRGVFYEQQSGAPRSLREIYAFFDKKFETGTNGAVTADISPKTALRLNDDNGENIHLHLAQKTQTLPQTDADPFDRINILMGTYQPSKGSILRAMGTAPAGAQTALQIFPPSLYGHLSLSAAQMMLLTDFSA